MLITAAKAIELALANKIRWAATLVFACGASPSFSAGGWRTIAARKVARCGFVRIDETRLAGVSSTGKTSRETSFAETALDASVNVGVAVFVGWTRSAAETCCCV